MLRKLMIRKKNNKISFDFLSRIIILLIVLGLIGIVFKPDFLIKTKKINAMMMLIEFEKIDGVLQWEKELDSRKLTALIKVQGNVLEENPKVFKRLAEKGYEVAGGYDAAPFWNMSYDQQYKYLKEAKEKVEKITGKEMRVFGSRYFAYDETTLRAADALGIKYILGRGVNDVEATVYQPNEYKVKIISVTNVDVGEPMGRGSLCDYSLWARGADAEEFGKIFNESVAKNPNNMILVSHAYLGGTRLEWWQEYEKALSLEKIKWNSFDKWMQNQKIIKMSNTDIPINNEVKYVQPQPAKAMEDYEPIPGLKLKDEMTPSLIDDGAVCL